MLVAVGVDAGPGGASVETASRGHLRGVVVVLGAGVGAVVLWLGGDWCDVLVLVVMVVSSCDTTSGNGAELSVLGDVVAAATTSKPAVTAARCVVVLWGRAEALLALVVPGEPELEKSGKDEQEAARDIVSTDEEQVLKERTYAPMTATAKQTSLKRHAVRKLMP